MPRYRISKPLPVGTDAEDSSVASGSGALPPTTPTAATSSSTAPPPPPRNPARSAPLSPVPEVKAGSVSPPPAGQRVRPPPSAFRPVAPAVARSSKGKERSRDDQQLFPTRNGRAQWIVDPIESRRGAEIWEASERVILILGGEYLRARASVCCGLGPARRRAAARAAAPTFAHQPLASITANFHPQNLPG